MISIIDYEGGNLTSVKRAVNYLGFEAEITQDRRVIEESDRIIFPGVGAAGASMDVLRKTGLDQIVRDQVIERKKPFLAICIGIQILFEWSEEDDAECLGFLKGKVRRFPDHGPNGPIKIPQIGWNQLHQVREHPLYENVANPSDVYFVNSFYCEPEDPGVTIGETEYGLRFTCAVAKENIVATQFHLEKSGPIGLRMLKNFCRNENWT
ncbi:MAG: imidazole glycerol phosphate synthase subunit HisH [bacterium]|nr:imidazole glycerol phosphate synthase subunit HisH [bacterium]